MTSDMTSTPLNDIAVLG